MSLTDKNEQDRLKNWVTIKGDLDPFGRKETEGQDSFWIARTSEDSYIIDYDFDTIPEFENLCKEIIKVPMDIELERIISVAAFKNMPFVDVYNLSSSLLLLVFFSFCTSFVCSPVAIFSIYFQNSYYLLLQNKL